MDKAPPSGDLRYQALLQLLHTADTIWSASHTFFERWSISPSQFNILNLLHSQPEGLSQSELSRQLIMHRSNVTGLVDRLERKGLVNRKELPNDRRAYRVVLTKSGASLLAQILPDYYRGAERIWDGLSTKRINDLIEGLRKAAANAETIVAETNDESASVGGHEGI